MNGRTQYDSLGYLNVRKGCVEGTLPITMASSRNLLVHE